MDRIWRFGLLLCSTARFAGETLCSTEFLSWPPSPSLSPVPLSFAAANISDGAIMGFDFLLGGAVAALLLVYLGYALIHPEKF